MAKFKITWRGDEVAENTRRATKRAWLLAAMDLQQESAEEAPIEKGDLRGNATVDDSLFASRGWMIVGYSLPYALRQHEELDYNHPKGGKAKYLEDPYRRNIRKYKKFVADAVAQEN